MRVHVGKRGPDGQNVMVVPGRITRLPPVYLEGTDVGPLMGSVSAVVKIVSEREHLLRHPDAMGPG